jgi:tripartite-type tricarboxylate transporter receptor subunit TctC
MKHLELFATAGLAVAVIGTGIPSAAMAETDAEFYKNRRLTFHVGFGVGGGYDAYARAVGRHLGHHIPGNPSFVVKNRPGAGSLRLTNELYNVLPQDGSAIGMVSRGVSMEVLFGNKRAKFDPTKFNWIGNTNNEVSICVAWRATGIDTLEKLLRNKIVIGASGPGSDTTLFAKALNNVTKANMKIVLGYPTGTAINVAMERGEVQARCGWSWSSAKSTHPHWLKDKKVNILLQLSTSKHPELTKKGVPWIMDLAKNDRDRKVLTLIFARQAMGRPILTGPRVPESRVAVLRKAFDATMTDPKFLEEVRKRNLELTPMPGTELQTLITSIMSTPPDIVQAAKEALHKTEGMFISKAKVQFVTHTGPVSKIKRGGRRVWIKHKGKEVRAKISGSRTKVTINGKKAKRKAIKVGMTCSFTYPGAGQEAKKVDCKGLPRPAP